MACMRLISRFREVRMSGDPMYEGLISGGAVRRLWFGETELYRQHLLRLDAESRRNRFGGAVSDEFIARYAAPFALNGAIMYGRSEERRVGKEWRDRRAT